MPRPEKAMAYDGGPAGDITGAGAAASSASTSPPGRSPPADDGILPGRPVVRHAPTTHRGRVGVSSQPDDIRSPSLTGWWRRLVGAGARAQQPAQRVQPGGGGRAGPAGRDELVQPALRLVVSASARALARPGGQVGERPQDPVRVDVR